MIKKFTATLLMVILFFPVFSQKRTYTYLFPFEGAKEITPENNLIIRSDIPFAQIPDNSSLTVTDSNGKKYEGTFVLAEKRKTLLFNHKVPFSLHSTITVNFKGSLLQNGQKSAPLHYSFYTRNVPLSAYAESGYESEIENDASPDLEPSLRSPLSREIILPDDYPYYKGNMQNED